MPSESEDDDFGRPVPPPIPSVLPVEKIADADSPIPIVDREQQAVEPRLWRFKFGWSERIGLGLLVLVFAIPLVVDLAPNKPTVAPQHEPVAVDHGRTGPSRNPKIPVEVSYPVTDDVIGFGGTKRTVSVRLNIKVSEDVLREIALEIKASETAQYEFTRINFYLPGQVEGHGCWAMADFDSGLRVVIMGLTIEEERLYRTAPLALPAGSEPLGTWILESGFSKSRITIYRRNGRWYYHLQSAGTEEPGAIEMDELPAENGHVFRMQRGSDRYVVGALGDLEIFNSAGKLISRPTPIVPPPAPR